MVEAVRMFVVCHGLFKPEPECHEVYGTVRGGRLFRAKERTVALDYRLEVPLRAVHKTARGAWEAYAKQAEANVAGLRERLAVAEGNLKTANMRLADVGDNGA